MDQNDENPTPSGPPLPDIAKTGPSIPPPSIPPPTPVASSEVPPPSSFGAPVITPPPLTGAPPKIDEEDLTDEIAPFNTRVIAGVIDSIVALGLYIAVWIILHNIPGTLMGLAYFVTRDSLPFLGGQSIGKKAMKIRAVTLDDRSLAGNWEPGLIRNGVLAIPLFALVELFVLLSREEKPERGRRLGDEWAKTKVIVVREPVV